LTGTWPRDGIGVDATRDRDNAADAVPASANLLRPMAPQRTTGARSSPQPVDWYGADVISRAAGYGGVPQDPTNH
jgi:hypothetical protein